MRGLSLAGLCALLLAAPPALGAESGHGGHGHGGDRPAVVNPACAEAAEPRLLCARTATPHFAADGTLWVAWTDTHHVYVSRSADQGRHFAAAVRITPEPVPVDANGENRPKVTTDASGRVFVSYTVKGTRPYTGLVRVSRSVDGGATFSPPVPISDERTPASQRFDTLSIDGDGRLYLAWIDKRDLFAAKTAQTPYRGAALYYAVSDDGGATFSANHKILDHSCECCRLASTVDGNGRPVLMWRNIFAPNVRDHALLRFEGPDRPGPMHRVSVDDWAVDGCPHHGPSISAPGADDYHVAWYTDGRARQGLFYARSRDGGKGFTAPMAIGRDDRQASHPSVLAVGRRVFLAWTEFDGERTLLQFMQSPDSGVTWSAPLTVATSVGETDHALLVSDGAWVHASWQTAPEGYHLIALAGGL